MTRVTKYFPLQGGEDLITPALTIKPGKMIFSRNYECDQQGRPRRVDGFERFDGRPAPSDASYCILGFEGGGTVEVEVEAVLHGNTSGASAQVIDIVIESGSWVGADAAGYFVLDESAPGFTDGETISFTGPNPGFSVGFSGGFS